MTEFDVLEPAYVDAQSARLIQPGVASRRPDADLNEEDGR